MRLEHWLEKYFVWLALPVVLLAGYFLADGALRLRQTATVVWTPPPLLAHEAEPAPAALRANGDTVLTSGSAPSDSRQTGDTEFEIARARLDATFEARLRAVRFVPETKDGKVLGIRLYGIQPGSPLTTIGLQNRDRVDSINGLLIGTPEQALEAYGQLRTATTLVIALERRGTPVSLTIHVRN